MKRYTYSILLFLLIGLNSCVDEINLKVDSDNKKISVDGLIADEPDNYQIRLSYTTVLGQGTDIVQDRITGASVKVIDDLGSEVEFLEVEDGVYEAFMDGEVGRTYYAEIVIGEKLIRSKPQTILPKVEIDSLSWVLENVGYQNNDGFTYYQDEVAVNLFTSIDDNIARPYLRWRVEGEFQFVEYNPLSTSNWTCYVPNTIDFNTLFIFDSHNLNGNFLFDQEIARVELDWRFIHNYCFHIRQYSISEDEYRYWEKIKELSYAEGSLFDPPPGRISGNVYNVDDPHDYIAGYFSVSSVSYKRYFLNRYDMDVIIRSPCGTGFRSERLRECDNCLEFRGSTHDRPDYWRN